MLRMNGQFLNVQKEEGLSPAKLGEFVPEKNLKIIIFYVILKMKTMIIINLIRNICNESFV